HFNPFDPSGRYVIVPDKGADQVVSYLYEAGRLSPASVPAVNSREGAGPRHIAFHPDGAMAYCVNELDSTVTSYAFNRETGALQALQVVSALPQTYTGNSRASGIIVDIRGR